MNTKQTWRIIALTIIFSFLVVNPLFAEEPLEQPDNVEYWSCCWGDRNGGGRSRDYGRYDNSTIETLDGEVVSLDNFSSRRDFQGTHFMIETSQETIEVHVAPSWYLAEQDFDITPQKKITVIGSRINIDGKEAIIARELKKGDRTLTLRDENGFPMWRGGQR